MKLCDLLDHYATARNIKTSTKHDYACMLRRTGLFDVEVHKISTDEIARTHARLKARELEQGLTGLYADKATNAIKCLVAYFNHRFLERENQELQTSTIDPVKAAAKRFTTLEQKAKHKEDCKIAVAHAVLTAMNPEITLEEFSFIYMKRHSMVHKKTWKEDARIIHQNIFPALGAFRLRDVRRHHIAALHAQIGEIHPYSANRTLEIISKMFNLAEIWGYLEGERQNPAHGVQRFRERSRDRWITQDEMVRLMSALAKLKSHVARNAILLLLLTGMRKSEVLNLRWTDIDFNRKELRIEDTKAGRPLYLPLSYQVMTLLDEITQQNEWVFPSTQKIGFSAKNIWRAWDSVRKLAGLEDVRIHDLRRTVGSWMAQEGADRHLIGKVLNQTSPEVTAIYARFADKQVRQVLQQHGDRIGQISSIANSPG